MENVLVPVIAGGKDIWLVIHAMQLATRLEGNLYILEVDSKVASKADRSGATEREVGATVRPSWTTSTEEKEGRSAYFHAQGEYCEEILKFCSQHRVTTVVLELAPANSLVSPGAIRAMVRSLQSKNGCHIELIARKCERGS
jgi:K+-sensing histidine kinase KdpD